MSYQLKIDPKSRKASRFISKLQKAIQKALRDSGKTQQEVAESLGVDRSVINRRLKGSANLTARSIAEFAYALDKEISIEFVDAGKTRMKNWTAATDNVIDIQFSSQCATIGTIKPFQKFSLESTAS